MNLLFKGLFASLFGLASTFFSLGQCLNESFTNMGPYSGYATETWTGDDGYTFTATDARTDQTINGDAICVRNGSLSVSGVTGGIGNLTLTTQREYSGGSGVLDIHVNGASVGTIPYDGTVQTSTITGINITGTVNVEIFTPGNSDRVKMDDLTWTCFASSNTISTGTVSPLSYTVDCSNGQSGTVNFTSVGTFNAGNVFTAELSDATGSFASSTSIGTLTLSGTDPSGTINFTIPAGTASGTTYRIRVSSSDPGINGSENGTDISITLSGGPCTVEPPHITSLIINSCNTSCGEGNNEVIFGNTGDYSVDMNTSNIEVTYGTSPSPTTTYSNPVVSNSTTTSDLNTASGCPGLFLDAAGTTVPPNSSFMLVNDAFCPGDGLDFTNFCGSGPIYVIYTTDANWNLSGNFVNSSGCSGGVRYLSTTITATDGSTHTIDYEFDCTLNSGTDGDYAKWDFNGGMAIEQGNNGCSLDPVVLPVDFVSLSLEENYTDGVDLHWETLSELNNDRFILYHSSNGVDFEYLTSVEGSGTTHHRSLYSSIHRSPVDGVNYYMLRSVDYDGTMYLKGLAAIEVDKNIAFYNNDTETLHFPSKGDYKVLTVDGRLLSEVQNSDQMLLSSGGIVIVQDLNSGKSYKVSID